MSEKSGASDPRYKQLAAELRAEILSGRFVAHAIFHTETDLCERFGVSRFTVREALRQLQGEGLIARKRGAGTIVQPPSAHGGTLRQPLSNIDEILQYARDSVVVYEPAGSAPLPEEVTKELGQVSFGNWTSFSGMRRQRVSGEPIAAIDVYLHPRLSACADRIDFAGGPLFSQVERMAGFSVSRVTQDIKAVVAGLGLCRALGVKRGHPILRITRCFFDEAGDVFEVSISHHPGDRFAYSMHIDVDR